MTAPAEIYDAELTPGKLELLAPWVARQEWFDGDPDALEQVQAYRLVDPDGEVGIEGFLLRCGPRVFHVPVTYRAEPLAGGDPEAGIGTLQHSVLGLRYVYDAVRDPLFVAGVTRVVREMDGAADQKAMETGEVTASPVELRSGGGFPVEAGGVEVVRVVGHDELAGAGRASGGPGTLTGTWADGDATYTSVLARVQT